MKTWIAVASIGLGVLAGFAAGRRGADSRRTHIEAAVSRAAYGACAALESARTEKLLEPEESSRVYQEFIDKEERAAQSIDRHFRVGREKRSCPQILDSQDIAVVEFGE